ncbi:hypothetical protein M3Y96_00946700 [Aphelenchoides besseyi]|nr:hypothetical protein M3Y96_00946700 [Aphelenchoides besseyi]
MGTVDEEVKEVVASEDEDQISSDDESLVDVVKDGAFAKASDLLQYVETFEITETMEFDRSLVDMFHCTYTDIIDEFADVEIFLISLDSLLIEFTAHAYHNWTLAGQTIVLAHQVRAFFERLNDLNAKYKLVWFRDFEHKYKADVVLNFMYNYLVAFLDTSEYALYVEKFSNPLAPEWEKFLKRLTPSFLLMSVENPSTNVVNENVEFIPEFASIAVQLISNGIPVVYFEAFAINFSTVFVYRVKVIPVVVANMDERISKIWSQDAAKPIRSLSAGECSSPVDLLALVLKSELKREKSDPEFEKFCLSVLLAAHIGKVVGHKRYIPDIDVPKVAPILLTRCRRRVIEALTTALQTLDVKTVNFSLDDLWDGRLINWIFANAMNGRPILPYRLQEEFAKLHAKVGFKEALVTDEEDTLISPSEESTELLINNVSTFPISNELYDAIFKNDNVLNSVKYTAKETVNFESVFRNVLKWRFYTVEDRLLQLESKQQLTAYEQKKANRMRQKTSKWYQAFSDSLEGRTNDLLVDFSRTPKLSQIKEEPAAEENGHARQKGGKDAKKQQAGKKAQKAPKLSKKDQILEANKQSLVKKQVENDKIKIQYATNVKTNAIQALENVKRKLQLDESKAICGYELALRYGEIFFAKAPRCKTIEEKRSTAIDFVSQLKECFTKHWKHLDNAQKEKIQDYWCFLGFYKNPKKMNREFDLGIDMIYYQLYHGGRLVDVLSDPQEDDRVTGFWPDAWQRNMLDVVDRNHSALIVAPTSAGKTFVSYYCIEKVLRQSNENVVVYVCPSKALINQVCGSIYARFRNKPLTGNTVLFGTMFTDYFENALNCQVLVTIPECLETLLLSPEPKIQEFVGRIRYVILDEVHCINASKQGHIWEHIFLLIQCPFLALSATISNVDVFHQWLQDAEQTKSQNSRNVELIVYKERWSELELSIQKLKDCPKEVNFTRDNEMFLKGISMNDVKSSQSSVAGSLMSVIEESILHYFTPYSVYAPEKIKMFSVPDDQQLTARQIVELYTIMAEVDEKTKKEFEPSSFFGFKSNSMEMVWLTRKMIRELESGLKERFLHWLYHDQDKSEKVFERLGADVREDFEKRMKPFNMFRTALYNVVPLLDELKANDMLPGICFNENREFCEQLAMHVYNEMDIREKAYMDAPEFKRRFNFKAEDRLAKIAKRKRDVKEDDKKKGGPPEDEPPEDDSSNDQFAMLRMKLKEALSQFKLIGRSVDEELYDKTVQRLITRCGSRQSTKLLLKLFERGIGFHHDGLNSTERGTVEILFRNGNLGILFSTATLALGMNMPCKTVIFGIDTPQLTPLQFRQMSGRAGRRGYDPAGTVIFMALPTSKIRRLLTASLATLRGNVPYTASFLLRLFTYINGNPEEFQTREEIASAFRSNQIGEAVATTLLEKLKLKESSTKKTNEASTENSLLTKEGRVTATLTLLKQSFALYTRHGKKEGAFSEIMKALSFFNVQFLRRLQLIDETGDTTGFAKIAVHLGVYEPGNLLFVHLLQIGAFHKLCSTMKETPKEFNETFVLILAHLFTNRRLPISDSNQNDAISLKRMPEKFEELIATYNTETEQLLLACLQLFFPSQRIDNEYFRLSGKSGLRLSVAEIVSTLDDDICLDPAFIPAHCENVDHRGRPIYRNSYAYDFYIHGSKDLLISDNKLDISEVWYAVNDFNRVLQSLQEVLNYSARMNDALLLAVQTIAADYDKKFRHAFGMKIHY